jgi:hypothetical protein
MLTFREFVSDDRRGCLIHAQTGNERVRFDISGPILMDILGSGNPIHHQHNVGLCEQKRGIILAACQRAYDQRPAERIALKARDFSSRLV